MHATKSRLDIPYGLGGKETLMNGPMTVKIRSHKVHLYGLRHQWIPIKDYLNFKNMTSNEILLNLENHENFAHSELVGGLIELANRDKQQEFDWNEHPITAKCLDDLKFRQPNLNPKHIAQTQLILDRLRITDSELWQLNSLHTLRLLHRYKPKDFAQFLDIFSRDVVDDEGEPILLGIHKADEIFFERIIGLLPMHVKEMNNHQVIRCLEVMVDKNIGSQRLFDHYILYMIEKHVLRYPVNLYSRMIRVMADKGFVEDYVFWDKFAFRYVYVDPLNEGDRVFTHDEAKKLWDSFVYLKLKCPTIDIKGVILQLEKFIEAEAPVEIEESI